MREVWGDKASVDVSARKVYTTFKSLGVLAGSGREPLVAAPRLRVPAPMTVWVVHALLLTRQTDAVADSDMKSTKMHHARIMRWPVVSRIGASGGADAGCFE